jgi:hypothetical protein
MTVLYFVITVKFLDGLNFLMKPLLYSLNPLALKLQYSII